MKNKQTILERNLTSVFSMMKKGLHVFPPQIMKRFPNKLQIPQLFKSLTISLIIGSTPVETFFNIYIYI